MRVEQVRGGVVEAVHEVHVAVVDSTGSLVARTGDPELVTFWRSAAKPFQALPLLEDGAAARFGLTSEELALACASHSSEPDQVRSAEHTSELQSPCNLVCRLLLEIINYRARLGPAAPSRRWFSRDSAHA